MARNHRHHEWTRFERNRLATLYRLLSFSEIAKVLDMTYDQVRREADRMGLQDEDQGISQHNKRNKITNAQMDMINTLLDEGFTSKEIYDALFAADPEVSLGALRCRIRQVRGTLSPGAEVA